MKVSEVLALHEIGPGYYAWHHANRGGIILMIDSLFSCLPSHLLSVLVCGFITCFAFVCVQMCLCGGI